MLVLVPLVLGFGAGIDYMKAATARVEAQTKAGEKPTVIDRQLHDVWTENVRDEVNQPGEDEPRSGTKRWRSTGAATRELSSTRRSTCLMGQTFGFIFGGGFFAASRMLVGMGLMKLGVFSAQRSRRFYCGWSRWATAWAYR